MVIRRAFLTLFLAILGIIPCSGASIGINQFSGLDTQDNPSALQPSQSQDLQNVRLQPGGRSVFKRDGEGLFQALPSFSTSPVHGGYHFQQSGGSDVQLWGSDFGLFASVGDSSFVKVASGTIGATWQCTDNLGFAYCVTNANDTPVKTDGTTANTSYQSVIPSGSIIASTPLQLVVAGVSGSPSTLFFSANNNFLNFAIGPLATDPYQEIINSPGSRLTHMGYYFGNLYWWKDQSCGYVSGSASQGTVGITIVSNQIGTLDNSSAFWNPTTYDLGNKFNSGAQTTSSGNPYFNEMSSLGGIFTRGQDNHFYQYDGYSLTRLSRIITPNVTTSSRRKANSWTQTTQTDLQSGSIVPAPNLSTSLSPGDVIVSSFQAVENSSTQWTSGSTNNTTIYPSSITLTLNNSGNITNPDFESSFTGTWTDTGNTGAGSGKFRQTTTSGLLCGDGSTVILPKSGSQMAGTDPTGFTITDTPTLTFQALDQNFNIIQSIPLSPIGRICSWVQATMTPINSNLGKRVTFQVTRDDTGVDTSIQNFPGTYIWGGPISIYFNSGCTGTGSCASQITSVFIDNITLGSSTITSGSFTSQVYNTGFTSATYSLSGFSWTANTSTPTFNLQTSKNSTGPWRSILTSSATNAVGDQFVQYTSTISIGSSDNAQTFISSVTIIARSTGTYYSAVNNAPNLSRWNSFTTDDIFPGISSVTYYTRASTNTFTVLSSTPAWVLQTKNATVAASTGTFMQMRGDFYLSAATETPTLNDFTFNWFEGTASDKAYINYFQDAIWFSVSSGSGTSSNNTIFYLDLLNNTWLKDTISANGFAVENNALYIGDPLSSNVYKFGGVTTDNGSAIRAYWKSMDFTGQDPTVQNSWEQADFSFAEASTTVSFIYNVDQSSPTTVLLPLFSPNHSIVKRGLALANGKIGTYYNFRIEDNSSSPAWTLMGQRTSYDPLPWRPQLSQ